MEKGINDYVLEILIEILNEKKDNKKIDFKERIYQFNELDLLLSKGVDVNELLQLAKYHKDSFIQISKYDKFDAVHAMEIEKVYGYLQELAFHLTDKRIRTQYEYYIDGKVLIPTEDQKLFVEAYLRENDVPVNDVTYCLALRRLIVGGHIESKFDREYLLNRAIELQKEKNNNVGV